MVYYNSLHVCLIQGHATAQNELGMALLTGALRRPPEDDDLYGHLTIVSIHCNFRIIVQHFEIIVKWFISVQKYEFIVK